MIHTAPVLIAEFEVAKAQDDNPEWRQQSTRALVDRFWVVELMMLAGVDDEDIRWEHRRLAETITSNRLWGVAGDNMDDDVQSAIVAACR